MKSPVHRGLRRLAKAVLGLSHAPGDYASPIPSEADWREAVRRAPTPVDDGVERHLEAQADLVRSLEQFLREFPYEMAPKSGQRYQLDNAWYAGADAVFFYAMLRRLKPRHVIEVGSGFSSALLLDTASAHLGPDFRATMIEPRPARLKALLTPSDRASVQILEMPVQQVPLNTFEVLGDRDILFIDSSHITRAGSDLNFLMFEVIPRLKSGVRVHFHDVFHTFEYPPVYFEAGLMLNECYLLRAFLQFNSAFTLELSSTQAAISLPEWLAGVSPLCVANPGGSMWLTRK